MKLIKSELDAKVCADVRAKVLKHAPWGSHVREQIRKNFGLWNDGNLIRLKILNPKDNIIDDLYETT